MGELVNDGLAAAARLTCIPMDDVQGFIIVTVAADGRVGLASNACCMTHLNQHLAAAMQRVNDPDAPPVTLRE